MFKYLEDANMIEYIDEYINFVRLLDESVLENQISDNLLIVDKYAMKNSLLGLVSVMNHLLLVKNNQSSKFIKIVQKKLIGSSSENERVFRADI